jgi:hypothetical protein
MAGPALRLERWILALQRDRPRMARYVQVAWWISNAFLLLGVILVVLIYSGRWTP